MKTASTRLTQGPASAMRISRARIQAALRLLVEQGNAGDGQQHHAAHADAVARRDHGVAQLMRQHREQHQQHQQKAAQPHLRAASGFQHPHQAEHQRKAEVHPEVDSEDVDNRNGPASHAICLAAGNTRY